MKAAAEIFAEALASVSFYAPEFSVYHNIDNKPATLVNIPKHLLEQLYSPVNWIGAVEACRPTAELAVEFGPGKVLAGLNRRIDKTLETLTTGDVSRSEEHTSELQSRPHLVCRLLLEKKKK